MKRTNKLLTATCLGLLMAMAIPTSTYAVGTFQDRIERAHTRANLKEIRELYEDMRHGGMMNDEDLQMNLKKIDDSLEDLDTLEANEQAGTCTAPKIIGRLKWGEGSTTTPADVPEATALPLGPDFVAQSDTFKARSNSENKSLLAKAKVLKDKVATGLESLVAKAKAKCGM